MLSIEELIHRACLLEATARKPGNVHPEASFADLTYRDFVRSAEIGAPILAQAAELGIGRAVLQTVRRTREAVGTNTNLGMALLLAPLAAVPSDISLREGIGPILDRLTRDDAAAVYDAIRLAQPGGMGRVAEQDITQQPTETLLQIMHRAAGRDRVAEQYATDFRLVLHVGAPFLERSGTFPDRWEQGVVDLHLRLMAEFPDTLILRKCGDDAARRSAEMARAVLAAGGAGTEDGRQKLQELDAWLRTDGHRRNPGTTADLVTASLFAALRDGRIEPPPKE